MNINPRRNVPIQKLSDDIMKDYDANKDGKVSLRGRLMVNHGQSETTRIDRTFSENPDIDYPQRELSRKDLFEAADEMGDDDGHVTSEELTQFIESFDLNNNGKLDSRGIKGMLQGKAMGELDLFNRDYDEVRLQGGIED